MFWVFFPSVCCCNQEIFFSYRYQPSHTCLSPLLRPMIPHMRESSPPESLSKTNNMGVDPEREKEKKPPNQGMDQEPTKIRKSVLDGPTDAAIKIHRGSESIPPAHSTGHWFEASKASRVWPCSDLQSLVSSFGWQVDLGGNGGVGAGMARQHLVRSKPPLSIRGIKVNLTILIRSRINREEGETISLRVNCRALLRYQ